MVKFGTLDSQFPSTSVVVCVRDSGRIDIRLGRVLDGFSMNEHQAYVLQQQLVRLIAKYVDDLSGFDPNPPTGLVTSEGGDKLTFGLIPNRDRVVVQMTSALKEFSLSFEQGYKFQQIVGICLDHMHKVG